MLVKLFDTGTGKAKSAINYLLGDKDHSGKTRSVKPEVLDGDPKIIAMQIDGSTGKWKYTSGAIAFRDSEKPTPEQMKSVTDAFEAAFFPALKKAKNFSVLWVLHQDKGNTELHFLTPRTEHATGRALNIHPPGKKSMAHVNAWTAVMNQHLGFSQVVADPLKLALSGFQLKSPGHAKQTEHMQNIHKVLETRIRTGRIANRDQLCAYLVTQGIEIHRRGEDYISIGKPGSTRSKRFKGAIYTRNADYKKILEESDETRQPKSLGPQEFLKVQSELHSLINARKIFNVASFLTKNKPRFVKNLERLRDGSTERIKSTRVGANFDSKTTPISVIAATKIDQPGNTSLPGPFISATAIQKSLSSGFRSVSSGAGPPSGGNDLASIQISIGNIQGSIDAAIAEVANSKSPAQRESAERKLASLLAQKMQLEAQLGQAKIREINRNKI